MTISVGDLLVGVETAPEKKLSINEPVGIVLNRRASFFFDATTEARLRPAEQP